VARGLKPLFPVRFRLIETSARWEAKESQCTSPSCRSYCGNTVPNALLLSWRNAIDHDRRRIGDPNDLARLVRAPRTRVRSQSITRPFTGISDNQHLRAALTTNRNRKRWRGFRLYGHLNLQRPTVPVLAQKKRWELVVDSGSCTPTRGQLLARLSRAWRFAADIAKLPELLQKIVKISGEHIAL